MAETTARFQREGRPTDIPPSTLGLPSGWFVVATSEELRRGDVLTRRFMSEELVLYRSASGEARAATPYCPHLGAHLGKCGTVEGELLRCGFHGFRFNGAGACVATGYGTRPPKTARLGVWPVREQHGVVLVWHHPAGTPPSWEVPTLDIDGWSSLVFRRFHLRGHPQETTENSVDIGHLSFVHGFLRVEELSAVRTDGPYLTARYAMTPGLGPLARLPVALRVTFRVHVHGLGYSVVESDIQPLGLQTRQFVFSTPSEPGFIDLLIAMSTEARAPRRALGPLAALVPGDGVAALLSQLMMPAYSLEVQRDFEIWKHKRYIQRPALAAGDGPLGLYRKWASQFYAA